MTHYETLGVDRDATDQQIKAAYRRLAWQHHPDREGGSTEKMAAIQQAYDCLIDPSARAAYDAGKRHSEEQDASAAREILTQLFNEALSLDYFSDVVERIDAVLRGHQPQLQAKIVALTGRRSKLLKWRGRVRSASDVNLMESAIAAQIAALDDELYNVKRSLDLNGRALALLAGYVDRGPQDAEPTSSWPTPKLPGAPR